MIYKQVKFRDSLELNDISLWTGGIAVFEDTKLLGIICGCCGGFIERENIWDYEILPWVNIEEEIRGDD